jgi:hypothetical protein
MLSGPIRRLQSFLGRRSTRARISEALDHASSANTQRIDALRRDVYAIVRHYTMPPEQLWQNGASVAATNEPLEGIFTHSTLCRQEHFDHPVYPYWAHRLNVGVRYHRKNWEFVFICQALHERRKLQPGNRGLGFGVGREPLPALFAAHGCSVVGGDQPDEMARQSGWKRSNQHAIGKEALRFPNIVTDSIFDTLVAFRAVDMNHIPEDLTGFDFCWSACALEHLGSIEAGFDFVENSLTCLKSGGVAVHTTEFNLSSDSVTIDNQPTVIFRAQDFRRLAARLEAKGHKVAPLDFRIGSGPIDRYIDVPPYCENPHLRLLLSGFVSTSFGMIIERR